MSNPTWPVYTFRVNLETLNRYSWSQPYFNTQTVGNETEPEGDNFKYTRSTWAPNLLKTNLAQKQDYTFTAYGLNALYLKNTYATGEPDALLVLVS